MTEEERKKLISDLHGVEGYLGLVHYRKDTLTWVEYAEARDTVAEAIEALKSLPTDQYEYVWMADEQSQWTYETKEEAEEFLALPRQFRRKVPGKWEEVHEH